jgi:hypothetical protein
LVGLTIVVPFLGFLFNDQLVKLLALSPEFASQLFQVEGESAADTAHRLTLTKLYLLYFGFSFLGLGSALFALLCPIEVKSHSSAREFLEAERPLASKARMGLVLPTIASHFLSAWEEIFSTSLKARLSHLPEFNSLFYETMLGVWIRLIADGTLHFDEGDKDDPLTDARGRPRLDYVALVMIEAPTVFQGVKLAIQELAATEGFTNDVLTLQYLARDHSKPWSRLLVSSLYGVGFFLLLIPTVGTFVRIIHRLAKVYL